MRAQVATGAVQEDPHHRGIPCVITGTRSDADSRSAARRGLHRSPLVLGSFADTACTVDAYAGT